MPTFGFEVEFIIPDEDVPIYQAFLANKTLSEAYADRIILSSDCGHLIETKTHPLTLEEFNAKTLNDLRNITLEIIEKIGVRYTYYGTHFSAWGFSDDTMARCGDLDFFDQYAFVFLRPHPKDVYIDPFVNGRLRDHAIIISPRNHIKKEFFNYQINIGSYQAMLNFVANAPCLKKMLAWRPVPGGSLRICQQSRLELVLGWLPHETEDLLITYMKKAILQDDPIGLLRGDYVPIFSSKGRFGFSFLSGFTYSMKDIDQMEYPAISANLVGNHIPLFQSL